MEKNDHSHPHPHPKKPESVFDAMPPKFAFWAGFVTAIAIAAVIGLVVVSSALISNDDDGGSSDTAKNTNTVTNTAPAANTNTAPTAAAPTVPTGQIALDSLHNVTGEGDVTVVEYSDFQCPYCQKFHPTMQQMLQDYNGKVRLAYKHFPLNIHENAQSAAEASECAAEQGKFWEYGDKLFTASSLGKETYGSIADELGLDKAKFDDCVSTSKYKSVVTTDAAEAQKLGGQGTPYSLVLDKDGNIIDVISGAQPYEVVKSTIDKYVK